ncbi:hypothetical protein GQ55_2G441200 [Panicum hallii var. hallii]|uniref:Uncharacterized protein n=1 Tax=Panicum hallii var. hallii TaxID=1504633 RepID=A0A2T7EYV7_9POAL|nr:hypothetical protein GQ55_2G441200 [Panicum hallii var. hallii]
MVDRGALVTDAEVFFYELNYKVLTVFMLMLYPLVMVMSLAARTGSIFWLFRLDPFGSDEDVVEQPLVSPAAHLHVLPRHRPAAHVHGVPPPPRPHPTEAPARLVRASGALAVSTTYFAHYATLPSTIGVHPAEKVAAAAASLILSVFTTILVLWE